MTLIRKKICMIGDFAVGKTSLVSRYVHNVFSDKYLTTLGVKIDTQMVTLPNKGGIKLVVWDIAGTDRFGTKDTRYLQGAASYLLVVDGTRRHTLDTAVQLKRSVDEILNTPPFVVLVNKCDLQHEWEIAESELQKLRAENWAILKGSAKENKNVTKAFEMIATYLLR